MKFKEYLTQYLQTFSQQQCYNLFKQHHNAIEKDVLKEEVINAGLEKEKILLDRIKLENLIEELHQKKEELTQKFIDEKERSKTLENSLTDSVRKGKEKHKSLIKLQDEISFVTHEMEEAELFLAEMEEKYNSKISVILQQKCILFLKIMSV